MEHFVGHQQVLVKNNLVVAVLSFSKHDATLFTETFNKFDYDTVVDLCVVHKHAVIGSVWNGTDFLIKPFNSWLLNTNLVWVAPIDKPDGDYYWSEDTQTWEVISATDGDGS